MECSDYGKVPCGSGQFLHLREHFFSKSTSFGSASGGDNVAANIVNGFLGDHKLDMLQVEDKTMTGKSVSQHAFQLVEDPIRHWIHVLYKI
jgi:hypothetical protein